MWHKEREALSESRANNEQIRVEADRIRTSAEEVQARFEPVTSIEAED